MYKQTIELNSYKMEISLIDNKGTISITDKLRQRKIKMNVEGNKLKEIAEQKQDAILFITYLINSIDEDDTQKNLWKKTVLDK